MRLELDAIAGAHLLAGDEHRDERGSFTRIWDVAAASRRGVTARLDLLSVSRNPKRGTLRGLHWQEAPAAETKLIRCTRGRVFDVAVDVRPSSPTYLSWAAVELAAGSGTAVLLGEGLAHGFLTLEDDSEVEYLMTDHYDATKARGIRYDDPAVAIDWPTQASLVSDRDRSFPLIAR